MLFKIGIGIIVAAIVIVTILEEYIRRKRQKTLKELLEKHES